jgi:hypothetical protein
MGSKAVVVGDYYYPSFFLDLLIIINQLLKPITQSNGLFNNVTITFKNWRVLYSSKYIYSLLFNLKYCTF